MKLNSILRRWRLFLLAALALHGFYSSLQRRMTIDFWRRARSVKASSSDCEKVRNITLTESLKSLEPDDFRRLVNDLGHCPWHYNKSEHNKLRLELQNCCNARSMLLTTKQNAPLGTILNYETNPNKNITVTEEIYRMLPKEPPFLKKPFETCAVVGNGGILLNSFCGEQIDSMDYIFRLNLPPLTMAEHIGVKSHFITCNPSILRQKYERLFSRRKPFIDDIKGYGPAMIVLPAFAYVSSTEVSFRVFYSVEEFQLKNKVVYYHPDYLSNISSYWKEMGVEARRLSSGVMIVTAALELCKKVTLYGFWPFSRDPEGNVILHHYYDNNIPKPGFHAMPHEFFIYTKMHSKGALYLQVGKC
ncbi:alpha-2,8-sialyltransferase 8F-like [Rana temporaria]|uniref:alpha-2,8-sialyltransferase 8F-like n=1 Tax=Rana temporaria TaxID=8407 RepID=UPI001AADAFA7|nr:alpha-2,8-sialyltransferase 8F-like [Rana temporaria]XP_040202892.1 alpha-2,8-sialyltransferase 8F-like [Rana temporaria]